MKQQWYAEEQVAPIRSVTPTFPVATPSASATANALLSSMTEAELEAIAEEAGVTVDFVRQALVHSGTVTQAQQASAAAKTSAKSDYYQVSLRVRKPTRLSRRKMGVAVVLSAVMGVITGIFLGLLIVGSIAGNLPQQWKDYISVTCPFILVGYLGIGFGSKRLGALAGGLFGFFTILSIGGMAGFHNRFDFPMWQFLMTVVLPASILYTAIGGALGVLAASLRIGVSRVMRRRRERLQGQIVG